MESEEIESGETEAVISRASLEFTPEDPPSLEGEGEDGKLNCILQGPTTTFPGNGSTMEYFHVFLNENSNHSKIAIIDEERQSTYHEVEKNSKKLALTLRTIARERDLKNFNPNNDWVIAVCLPPSDRLIVTIFAIHKLGAAYVPIDSTFPENRITNIITGSRPILVISDVHPSTLMKFDSVRDRTEVITIDYLFERASNIENKKLLPFPSKVPKLAERVAIVLYTSGSSGIPKGVRLTHRTIMNRLFWQWETFPYAENERCCFKTALTFVDSVAEIFGPLLRGHSLTIFSKLIVSNPHLLIKNISMTQITRIVIVPSLLRTLLATLHILVQEEEESEEDEMKGVHSLSSIKLWVVSGETLHRELVDDFFNMFPYNAVLCNFYGSTEIMGDVTYEKFTCVQDVEKQCNGIHVPIGIPIYNTILYILDEQLKVVREGDVGELYVAGFNVSTGYVGIENTEKFIENPYTNTLGFSHLFRTGDFARIVKKYGRKSLFYEGRGDSQVKVRGHRVDLNEIESVLASHTKMIGTVVVLCFNPGKDDQTIVAFIIPKHKNVTIEAIGKLVKDNLKAYEYPEIRLIAEIPLLVNGKVDRQRLLNTFESHRNKITGALCGDTWNVSNIPPDLLIQARGLVQAIAEVTHIPPNEIINNFDDSFFNLGGNSLNSVCVVSRLRAKNLHLSLDDFISAKSIREMVPKIAMTTASTHDGFSMMEMDRKSSKYYSEFLSGLHEIEATAIIAHSFSRKGDLEVYTNASYQDFKDLMRSVYPTVQKKGYSIAVRRKEDKKIVGVAMNFDLYDEPEPQIIHAASGIQTVLDFLEFVESRQRDKLPKGRKKILHSFMMGTHEMITEAENVAIVTFMEHEIVRIAHGKHFVGVMTTNTNPLTRQICSELLNYETLIDFQINKYEEPDGSRPFRLAPDSQTVTCCWKKFDEKKGT